MDLLVDNVVEPDCNHFIMSDIFGGDLNAVADDLSAPIMAYFVRIGLKVYT